MATPTKRTKSDTVKVYNNTLRQLGCSLPTEQLAGGGRRPPREMSFLPGNNTVPRKDWEACLNNKVFARLLNPSEQPVLNGRKQTITPLVVGQFDKGQKAEEAALRERIEKERSARASGS